MKTAERMRAAIAAIARGDMVVVADSTDRENEGDLVAAAADIRATDMAFMLRHGSGIVCAPMSDSIADALDLPPMVAHNSDNHQTAFTVTVDAVSVGTGISAADRAETMRTLASPLTAPADLRRPGHVFPLRAKHGGVLERPGHTEAALDLVRLAGGRDVAVITELVDDDGVPMSGPTLTEFAVAHRLPLITVDELIEYRRGLGRPAGELGPPVSLPTDHGRFTAQTYLAADGNEHLVLTYGDIRATGPDGPLVRVHSECLTGDVLGSRRCDCGPQLTSALATIVAAGAGMVVYLRGHEGRGIGLAHKLAAYALQENGRDTVDANLELGLPVDDRDYATACDILQTLGVSRVQLITNNPDKISGLRAGAIDVTRRVGSSSSICDDNITYLQTKRDRLGHLLDLPAAMG